MSGKDLPIEIIIDILSRLPVKTLMRFRRVCKSWYSLICDPTFITMHLNRSASYGNAYILYISLHNSRKTTCTLLCNKTFDKHSELELELELQLEGNNNGSSCTIIGSINGLLCLTDTFSRSTIYICNPSIRMFKAIRPCSCPGHVSIDSKSVVIYGFGYHGATNDYKVVRILNLGSNQDDDSEGCEVEVYSLNTDSWRRIGGGFPWTMIDAESAELVNGCIHWIATYSDGEFVELILAFDVGDEVFREIMLPDYHFDDIDFDMCVGVLNESLCLFVYPFKHEEGDGICSLWVMREYGVAESWTKQFTVIIEGIHRSLGFTKFDQVLLEDYEGDVLLCDLKNSLIKYIDFPQRPLRLDVVSFMESLVLLEGSLTSLGEEDKLITMQQPPDHKCDEGSKSEEGFLKDFRPIRGESSSSR